MSQSEIRGNGRPHRRGLRVAPVAAFFSLSLGFLLATSAAAARPTRAVALQGDIAPGSGAPFTTADFTFDNFDEPFVNNAGDVVFSGCYNGCSQAGVFLSHGGVLSPIAVSGQVVPGVGTLSTSGDGPAFNSKSTVAFVANNITAGSTTAALFQKKLNGPLTALVKQGDPVPGLPGFTFVNFDDIAENNVDDVAFIALYTNGSVNNVGVFLRTSNGQLRAITLNGDALPGTGGTQCGTTFGEDADINGPWLNDLQVVTFKVDKICGGPGGFQGSLFIRLPGRPIQPFVLLGDPAPASIGGTMSDITISRPGLNNRNLVGFEVTISGGSVSHAILTKSPGGPLAVCMKDGDPAPGTTGVFISDIDGPAMNTNNYDWMAFESQISGDPNISKGIFTCNRGAVNAIALQTDPKPGTASGTFGFELNDVSLSNDGHVVFIDVDNTPFGVFVGPVP